MKNNTLEIIEKDHSYTISQLRNYLIAHKDVLIITKKNYNFIDNCEESIKIVDIIKGYAQKYDGKFLINGCDQIATIIIAD